MTNKKQMTNKIQLTTTPDWCFDGANAADLIEIKNILAERGWVIEEHGTTYDKDYYMTIIRNSKYTPDTHEVIDSDYTNIVPSY